MPDTPDALPVIPVVCALIESDRKLLAAKRNTDQDQAGKWEFPGGKVHSDESPAQALIREIKEELAIDILVGQEFCRNVHSYADKTIELIALTATITGGILKAHEHAEIRFVDMEEAEKLTWCEADVPIVKKYFEIKKV